MNPEPRHDPRQEYERRKQFQEDTKSLDTIQYQEMFRILKSQGVSYSENSNGIFFDVQQVPTETFDKLWNFLELCKKQKIEETKREEEISKLTHSEST